jgi:hypothetical protein
MLAVNISASMSGRLDDRPPTVESCTEGWWVISDTTLRDYADQIVAVANNVIVGVFDVQQYRRAANGKVVFQLAHAPDWQWLIGQPSPITWTRGQANPVRKVGTAIIAALRAGQPRHIEAGHGWTLEVAPDGRTATVRGPGALAVTAVHAGVVTTAVTGDPTESIPQR